MFREDKSTQMAAKFLNLAGGKLSYLHRLKMMYIADKAMTLEWGIPITFDQWVAMPHGPVLSNTYNCIRSSKTSYWSMYIKKCEYDLFLRSDPGDDLLSAAEDNVIRATYNGWGSRDRWDVVKAVHEFSEREDPHGSSKPITYDQMLIANGHASDIHLVNEHLET